MPKFKFDMKVMRLLAGALLFATSMLCVAQQRYAGGDISLLPEYVNAGAKYYDHDGKPVAKFLPWCKAEGMNLMRVRLFVNPEKYKQLHQNDNTDYKYDPNACQDLEYITPLCKDIADAGLDLMLDFHYSDTWADPAKQWTPIDWEKLTDAQLYDKIYEYTKESLTKLKDAGVTPAFIQPGNEISYGMLWGKLGSANLKKTFMGSDANWPRFGKLLNRAIEACREVCPDAKIVIHTERVANIDELVNFYTKMNELNVGYDIIGLSYYPYWHGDMTQLNAALTSLEKGFPGKNIMIVETGYALKWKVPGSTIDHTDIWPLTDAGQNKFAQDLVGTLEKHKAVNGLLWWWMEYNPYNTDIQNWYNAPLFDPTTGRASSAFKTICSFASSGAGVGHIGADPDMAPVQWYNTVGQPVDSVAPGLVISRQGKRINH